MKHLLISVVAMIIVLSAYMLVASNDSEDSSRLAASRTLSNEVVRLVGTNRIVTQIVIEDDESSLLGGRDRVIAAGTVTLLIGVDVDKANIVEGGSGDRMTIIQLPDPEVLSTELDESSVVFFRKATVIQRLSDLDGEDRQSKIRQKIKDEAHAFVRQNGLMPSKADIEARIRQLFSLSGKEGDIRFEPLTN